jgi:hypothetical protein
MQPPVTSLIPAPRIIPTPGEIANRAPYVAPVAVHTEFPCFVYYQGDKDTPSRIVKDQAALDALGSEWGQFPWTAEVVDRAPGPELPGSAEEEFIGSEYPRFVYHQLAAKVPARIVNDPDEEFKLGPAWGPMPFSEDRFELIQRKAKLEKALADQVEADEADAAKETDEPVVETPVAPVVEAAVTVVVPVVPDAPKLPVAPVVPTLRGRK